MLLFGIYLYFDYFCIKIQQFHIKMKKQFLSIAFVLLAGALNAQNLSSGIDKANFDTSVKPGDNFYEYAAGGWLKSHPLDAEHMENGAFVDLQELSEKRIQGIILEYAKEKQPQGSLGQKIGSMYNLMMDSVRLNREGAAPLQANLQRIKDIKSRRELEMVSAMLDREGHGTTMFDVSAGADQKQASMNIVSLSQGGLGMGSREYYFNTDEQSQKLRQAYKQFIVDVAELAGYSKADAQQLCKSTWDIELKLAAPQYDRVKLRDIDANYHKMSYAELVSQFPDIDWGNFFLLEGIPAIETVNVCQPEALHAVENVLDSTSLSDLKNYLTVKLITDASSSLSDNFRQAAFKFRSAVLGVKQDRPRWKRATGLVSGVLGEAVGKLYVQKYFPESSKKKMLDLVHNLQTALAQRIDQATWMSQATKAQTKDKLQNFIIKIGYPDKWKDYSGMQVDDSLSLYENMKRISRWAVDKVIAEKVNKKVDKMEWGMTPQTINAYYNPSTNEICFPAAILQPPFFDPNADDAVNYGAIGGVIGHEMSHGFDDQGAQFDKYGNQHDWWTAQDKKNFDARTKVLADYFSNFEVLPGVKINGKQTLGENIGDNGGLNIAFTALQNEMKSRALTTVNGFTPEQRFFLAWARVWASNATPEVVKYLCTVDVHSPNMARVNAALPQIDAWYKAFNVKKGDKMFVPKNKRAHIW